MKIAILTCGILPIPAVQGGAVENLIDFYLEYNDIHQLHDITVYSPWNAKVKKHPALSSKVNHYVFIDVTSFKAKIKRRIYSYFHSNEYYNYFIEYYFEKIYAYLKNKSYDYIILENCPGYTYKLSQRGYKNLILHLHNDLLHSKSRYHDVIFKALSKILTVSDYIKERVSTIQQSNKINTICNGIDLHKFSPKDNLSINRKNIGFTENDFVIVYSGRINNEKGISELIDAMLQLKSPCIKLMILGSSFFDNTRNEDAFIQSLKNKAKRIEDQIIFTGFIPYSQVPEYLQLADISVLPSMWEEPFGLTIVEAMAVGLPLITTRSGGIPEICEGVAVIVERNNIVNNLANTILDLYQDPEKRKQMATASLERAKLFDKETYAKNFFAGLDDL
jgi:glycosyltransferase involved in cell wall biosynthesis